MSEETVLYGCIYGAHGGTQNWHTLYPLNIKVIESLPQTDSEPPLIRSMFAFPTETPGPLCFRVQPIYFAASFNHFSQVREKWVEKFEKLLRQLFWFEAHLHMDIELQGKFKYSWRIADNQPKDRFWLPKPLPVNEWKVLVKAVEG